MRLKEARADHICLRLAERTRQLALFNLTAGGMAAGFGVPPRLPPVCYHGSNCSVLSHSTAAPTVQISSVSATLKASRERSEMQSDKRGLLHPIPITGESNADYRKRMEELQAEAAGRRQQQIDQQSSPLNSPTVRIQAWERLHQVDLPRDPAHRLVGVIAANTGLTVDEVRAEQLGRAAATK